MTAILRGVVLLLLVAGSGFAATLTCEGSEYTAAEAARDLPNQYIVMLTNHSNTTAVLASLSPWTPTHIYEYTFPGFAGTMNQTQLVELLADARVRSIECDGEVSIAGPGVAGPVDDGSVDDGTGAPVDSSPAAPRVGIVGLPAAALVAAAFSY